MTSYEKIELNLKKQIADYNLQQIHLFQWQN